MSKRSLLGLQRGTVELRPYTREWQTLFAAERELLAKQLGSVALDIQHVGSTSIPGCLSKPILDVVIGVESTATVAKCIGPLTEIGYIHRGEQGIIGRELFVKGEEACRTHHVHIVVHEGEVWNTFTYFRDYMQQHPEIVTKYSELKQQLAEKYAFDRESYRKLKSPFVEAIIRAREGELKGP